MVFLVGELPSAASIPNWNTEHRRFGIEGDAEGRVVRRPLIGALVRTASLVEISASNNSPQEKDLGLLSFTESGKR